MTNSMYDQIGGELGCQRLAAAFYSHLGDEPALRRVYPAHVRCAIESLTWFFAEVTGGPPEHSRHTQFASLTESHRRFSIGEAERDAWLRNMTRALAQVVRDDNIREELHHLFEQAADYLVNSPARPLATGADTSSEVESIKRARNELWAIPLAMEEIVAACRARDAARVLSLLASPRVLAYFTANRPARARILAVLGSAEDDRLLAAAAERLAADVSLVTTTFSRGRTLLHEAAMNGAVCFAELLIGGSARADVADDGGHCPLYYVGNAIGGNVELVPLLVEAGADVNAAGGVKRSTALHMAARRGNVAVASSLLDHGANIEARDSNGVTPLGRAINCRKREVAALLVSRGAKG